MIRYPSILIIFLLFSVGFLNYEIKNSFNNNVKKIKNLERVISNKKDKIKLMDAEISYLSRPDRLEYIALNIFNMKALLPIDIWNINDISQLYFEKTMNKEK